MTLSEGRRVYRELQRVYKGCRIKYHGILISICALVIIETRCVIGTDVWVLVGREKSVRTEEQRCEICMSVEVCTTPI